MSHGFRCGSSRGRRRSEEFDPRTAACRRGVTPLSLGLFVRDDGGYTTVAVALALLVSLTLVFSAAAVQWGTARAADVQEVADATAMAGVNVVAGFTTIAQVVDACVLSLGLAGVMVSGAGLIAMIVPGAQEVGARALDLGGRVLEARQRFARSAAQGLQRLERALPALVAFNSASCVAANTRGGLSYVGAAVPVPLSSESDYGFLDYGISNADMTEKAREMADAAEQKEEAEQTARAAKERAWRADCVDDPRCMRSRAEDLAGLYGGANPFYASAAAWHFEYARSRAERYYAQRLNIEGPAGEDIEELTRSAVRTQFYRYAHERLAEATCIEGEGHTYLDLPELPRNSQMMRETWLYDEVLWPCTDEEGGRTLHSCLDCPAAQGAPAGMASLADLEGGWVEHCAVCDMDVAAMGSVAAASTNTTSGFEHYWRIVVEESRIYQDARERADAADEELRRLGDEGADLFERAIEALAVDRPTLRPAGYLGCVSVVSRKAGATVPSQLTTAFLPGTDLPAGLALSAATLAPDNDTDGNTVLSRVFDGFATEESPTIPILGNVCELWGRLLMGYGSAYGTVSDAADRLFDGAELLGGGRIAHWFADKLSAIVKAAGFEPADMRLRKPVLVNSQQVLDRAGLSQLGTIRALLQELPGSAEEIRTVNWQRLSGELGTGMLTIGTLPIPGIEGAGIPLSIDVSRLLEAI